MRRRLGLAVLLSLLLATIAGAVLAPPQQVYPIIEILVEDPSTPVLLRSAFRPRASLRDCEALTGSAIRVTLERCPQCRLTGSQCAHTIDSATQAMLGSVPLATPAAHVPGGGVITFSARDPAVALAACQAAAAQPPGKAGPLTCFASGQPRHDAPRQPVAHPWHWALLAAAILASWLTGWFILRYDHLHARITHDHVGSGPQKFHTQPTPRIGGIGVVMGLLAAGAILLLADALPGEREFGLLMLAGLPAFLGGLAEDVTKRVGVAERLLMTMLSGALAAWLVGAVLHRIDFPGVDTALLWLPFAVAFTSFAVGGVANAINIIDGYHGLAGGFSVIVLAALAWVASQVGDALVFSTALALAGALLGFLLWNWPHGRIFLGDGGAYFTGFLLAELGVLLVLRNPGVSPWFPLVLLVHPVFETLFSIYRRRFAQRLSPGTADGAHLHQLIHHNLLQRRGGSSQTNGRVGKYLWLPNGIVAGLGSLFMSSCQALATISVVYCALFVLSYRKLKTK